MKTWKSIISTEHLEYLVTKLCHGYKLMQLGSKYLNVLDSNGDYNVLNERIFLS